MPSRTIGLVAAIPEETRPLLRLAGTFEKTRTGPYKSYLFQQGRCRVRLVESGMGTADAEQAARIMLAGDRPDILMNIGFAGAIRPGLECGDLVVAGRIFTCRDGVIEEQPSPAASDADRLYSRLGQMESSHRCCWGSFISVDRFVNKRQMAGLIPPEMENPILEMETAAVAAVAASAGVPFFGLRVITDAADEELGFSLEEIIGKNARVSIGKVLLAIASKPGLIPQLLRLSANAGKGGKQLAMGIGLLFDCLSGREGA